MRIVQAAGWYYPESLGGTEVYVAGLCRHLRAAGHEITVAAPDPGRHEEHAYEHDGIRVYRYPIPKTLTRAEAQGLVPVRGAERLHAWLLSQRPDVVHLHTLVTGLGLAEVKAARAAGARVIVTAHSGSLGWICQRGTLMRWGEGLCDGLCRPRKCAACEIQHRGLARPLAWIVGTIPPAIGRFARALPGKLGTALSMSDLIARNQAMQRELLATVDKFVLLTEWGLEAVAANGAPREKLALNRIGLSDAGARPKPGPEERPTRLPVMVGYFGRFETIKGVHVLARAMASLPRDVPIRLELRGPMTSDTERGYARQLHAIVGRDPRITFAAPVPHEEASKVLASYDVLCCPAVCLEGGPTVAIEAHAVGTPVIGSAIGGLAELVTQGANGRLVPPGDWRALAAVLVEMTHDPAGTIDRWRRALPPARTMDEVAADYESLYAASPGRFHGSPATR